MNKQKTPYNKYYKEFKKIFQDFFVYSFFNVLFLMETTSVEPHGKVGL